MPEIRVGSASVSICAELPLASVDFHPAHVSRLPLSFAGMLVLEVWSTWEAYSACPTVQHCLTQQRLPNERSCRGNRKIPGHNAPNGSSPSAPIPLKYETCQQGFYDELRDRRGLSSEFHFKASRRTVSFSYSK